MHPAYHPATFTGRWSPATLIASLYVGNLMLLVLNLPLAPVWVRC